MPRRNRPCAAGASSPQGAGNSLAYPFGSRSEVTRRIAIEMGVETLLEVDGVNSPLDPQRIGRIKVGSDSVAALFAKMEVVEPVKSLLKRALYRLRLSERLTAKESSIARFKHRLRRLSGSRHR